MASKIDFLRILDPQKAKTPDFSNFFETQRSPEGAGTQHIGYYVKARSVAKEPFDPRGSGFKTMVLKPHGFKTICGFKTIGEKNHTDRKQ